MAAVSFTSTAAAGWTTITAVVLLIEQQCPGGPCEMLTLMQRGRRDQGSSGEDKANQMKDHMYDGAFAVQAELPGRL